MQGLKEENRMFFIDDLINRITDFECKKDNETFAFQGFLKKDQWNVVLNARIDIRQYRKIAQIQELVLCSSVCGKKITLEKCRIQQTTCINDDAYAYVIIVPDEIIVGKNYQQNQAVKSVTMYSEALNGMFENISMLYSGFDDPKGMHFERPIKASDECGELLLYQENYLNKYERKLLSVIEYQCSSAMPLTKAIERIVLARNLFAFFKNGYIPIENAVFTDEDEDSYDLWMNFHDDITVTSDAYIIRFSDFKNDFQRIWKNWLVLYKTAEPIMTLFYGILCNNHAYIDANCMLNISQAIELYSRRYREKFAKGVAKEDEENKSKNKDIHLIHRYIDVLSEYNSIFEMGDKDKIKKYAKALADIRNYYTHYNLRLVKPSYTELFAAIYVLRYILLTIVYVQIGIPSERILECKKYCMFRQFNSYSEIVYHYKSQSS